MRSTQVVRPVVLILGSHPFPHGNASANRMLTMAMTWRSAGWRPIVLSDHPHEHRGDGEDRTHFVNGVEYFNLFAPTTTRLERVQRRRSYARRVLDTVETLGLSAAITHVVVPSMMYTPHLRRFIARALPRLTLVVDVVERHDVTQFPRRGRLHPYYLRHRFTNWYTAYKASHVIVISTALSSGPYRSVESFVLPPCVDLAAFHHAAAQLRTPSPVNVTYFGSPGTKDDLSALLLAVALLGVSDRTSLRITLAGVTRLQLALLPGIDQELIDSAEDVLNVVGRLHRSEVIDLLGETHYSFLLRDPDAGFARYGFPSKVSESLAAGCPAIANLTSDLSEYLCDGLNALICEDPTPAGVATTLRRAVGAVQNGTFDSMSSHAEATARERFDPEVWAPQLRSWLLV